MPAKKTAEPAEPQRAELERRLAQMVRGKAQDDKRHAEVIAAISERHAKELSALKGELAYMKLQRDALLEMTWLDTPGEPQESTARWREEFEKGWQRRDQSATKESQSAANQPCPCNS